jgi:hypothetical protein
VIEAYHVIWDNLILESPLAVTAMNPQSALPLMYLITGYDGQADLVLGAFLLTTPVLCY